MRLFLIGWTDKDSGFYDVAVKLKESGHQIVYWSAFNIFKDIKESEFSGTIFHDSFDALGAKPAHGVDISGFLPVSMELVREFYETEVAVLTMMNKKYERFSIDERKHIYYSLLSYWFGALKKYKPDAVIFQLLPHTVFDFIIYNIAKKLKIKTLFFKLTTLGDRLFLLDDYKVYPSLLGDWRKLSKDFRLEDLSGDIREIYLRHKKGKDDDQGANPHVQYIHNTLSAYSNWNLIWKKIKVFFNSLLDLSVLRKIPQFIKKRFSSNLKTEYLNVQSPVDWNKKFIYATLAYQPECSTSPQGDIFVDQILMLETLSSVLPNDWVIYVKEHPVQWLPRGLNYFSYRYKGYYRKIAGLKNVKLVPVETSSFELIRNCVAVANVTGSSAFEAVLRLKPALIFGYEWYQDCPGIFRVSSSEDCRRTFERIKNGATHTDAQLINYLALVGRCTFRGYIDPSTRIDSPVSSKENAENLTRALLRKLK
mgnify:CR=1 FL=1